MTFSISNRVPKTVESLHHSFKIVSRTTCIQKYMYNLETDAALTRIYFIYNVTNLSFDLNYDTS